MEEKITKLKLKYGEIEFEIESDSETVKKEREEFQKSLISALEVLSRKMHIEPTSSTSLHSISKDFNEKDNMLITCNKPLASKNYLSFNQLVKEKNFNTDTDKVAAAAYFIEMCQGKESFTTNDIAEEFKKAKLKQPLNISLCINRLAKKAFIQNVGSGEKGLQLYSMLEDGILHCENYTPKEDVQKNRKTIKVSKSTKDYPSLNVTVDDLKMDNYCDITQLSKIDEQLWVLMYMYTKETEFNSFTRKELQRIMKEKFNLPLTDDQIRRFFENTGKNVDKGSNGREHTIRLLQGGFKKAEDIINKNKKI